MVTPRRVILLGASGSIGRATIEVIEDLNRRGERRFSLVGAAVRRNADFVAELAQRHRLEATAVAEPAGGAAQAGAVCEMIDRIAQPGDLVVAAMVGAAGIDPVVRAIERGCDIALANKETLVAAGDVVMSAVRRRGVRLAPIDSEHSAVAQCLAGLPGGVREVSRVTLTASGGPFRTWPAARISAATPEEALNHPTWRMGAKVTIDSASLVNKALELIEAHWLFGLDGDRLAAVVHPQSIVHALVECLDGSVIAQLAPPDMRLPIQHALCGTSRHAGPARRLDWSALRALEFEPIDHDRFPAFALAYRVIAAGGTAGAVFNAANEVAVEAFLARRLPFSGIAGVISTVLDRVAIVPASTLAAVHAADAEARAAAAQCIAS